VKITQ